MVEIMVTYEGQLHCAATHGPSQATISTDAPVDNNGRGESFSPTDLVATALASCMATIMGIYAQKNDLDLSGMKLKVAKHMTTQPPRRVAKLEVSIAMPIAETHPKKEALQRVAEGCPVWQSLHPDTEVAVNWTWA